MDHKTLAITPIIAVTFIGVTLLIGTNIELIASVDGAGAGAGGSGGGTGATSSYMKMKY